MFDPLHVSYHITTRSVAHSIVSYLISSCHNISYHITLHHITSHRNPFVAPFSCGNQQKSEAPAITVQVLSNRAFIKPKACAPTIATQRLFNTGATDLSNFTSCYSWMGNLSKGNESKCQEKKYNNINHTF